MTDSLFPELTREQVESVRQDTALADRTKLRDAVRRAVNERIGEIVHEIVLADREALIDPIVRDVLVKSQERMANIIEDTIHGALRETVKRRIIEQAEGVAESLTIEITVK